MISWHISKPVQAGLPDGILQLAYHSCIDGLQDRALFLPAETGNIWVVCIHGHGSHEDQLYTRADIRDCWLPCIRSSGLGVLTPNLGGNAWMSSAAASDLESLLNIARTEFGAKQFIFAGGSMGGTSNLIYSALKPGDAAGVIALGAVPDLAEYHGWCRGRDAGVLKEIADAMETYYGGSPKENLAAYRAHSVIHHVSRLTMPVYLAHGAEDAIMPVPHSRRLAALLKDKPGFIYKEVPGGHDSPLALMPEAIDIIMKQIHGGSS
jgi:pimeloyl-ACP methyl ester carboxylesterase